MNTLPAPTALLRLGLALALALTSLAVGPAAVAGAYESASTGSDVTVDEGFEWQFIDAINAERRKAGLSQLRPTTDMRAVARDHARTMAVKSDLHHNPNLGSDVDGWRLVAENVGVGSSIERLHRAFMDSPGHRANILNSRVTEVGLGVVRVGERIWVTQLFRLPSSSRYGSTATRNRGVPVYGDWNGDGTDTPGWFLSGTWTLGRDPQDGSTTTLRFGSAGDRPVVGDWDGDGRDDIGVRRGNRWFLDVGHNGGNAERILRFGSSSDVPVVGDWDGNGRDDIGVRRGSRWFLDLGLTGGNSEKSLAFGSDRDRPIVGDWDGNGRDDVGVRRGNRYYLDLGHTGGNAERSLRVGGSRGLPVAGRVGGRSTDLPGVVVSHRLGAIHAALDGTIWATKLY